MSNKIRTMMEIDVQRAQARIALTYWKQHFEEDPHAPCELAYAQGVMNALLWVREEACLSPMTHHQIGSEGERNELRF